MAAGELKRGDIRIRLQDQPFRLLCLLIEQRPALVTREEVKALLWPEHTISDAEVAVNSAIRKIRTALADSSEEPVYIETVIKRGYRFIGEVSIDQEEETEPASPEPAPLPPAAKRAMPWRAFIAGACSALVLAGVVMAAWRLWPTGVPRVLEYRRLTSDGQLFRGAGLFSDGVRLYYNKPEPLQLSVAGGKATPLPWKGDLVGIDPLGTRLLARQTSIQRGANEELFVISLPSGETMRTGLIGGMGTWSAPSNRLLFGRGSALWAAREDGSEPRELSRLPGEPEVITASPDGRTIRFDLRQPGADSVSLWESDSEGRNAHQIFSHGNATLGYGGSWTPDGRYYITWKATRSGTDLWALRGSESFQLTNGPLELSAPVVSRDARTIYAVGVLRRGEVVRYDPATRNFVRWGGESADDLTWSPNNESLLWTEYPTGTIWAGAKDGSGGRRLTPARMRALMPRWAPDGNSFVFAGFVPGERGRWKIYSMPAAGGEPAALTPDDSDAANPTFSPDGKQLVFGGAPWLQAFVPGSSSLKMMDMATRKISRVPGSENMMAPKWSPDGRWIDAKDLQMHRIHVFEVSTGQWRMMGEVRATINYHWWSADSKYVYFNTGPPAEEETGVFRVPVSGGKVERVVNLSGIRITGNLGQWFGLGPKGEILLLRDLNSQEIYSLSVDLP